MTGTTEAAVYRRAFEALWKALTPVATSFGEEDDPAYVVRYSRAHQALTLLKENLPEVALVMPTVKER